MTRDWQWVRGHQFFSFSLMDSHFFRNLLCHDTINITLLMSGDDCPSKSSSWIQERMTFSSLSFNQCSHWTECFLRRQSGESVCRLHVWTSSGYRCLLRVPPCSCHQSPSMPAQVHGVDTDQTLQNHNIVEGGGRNWISVWWGGELPFSQEHLPRL